MLKNDMRKYIIAGKTFDDFVADYGEEYKKEFSMDIMERCWKNTHKLVDPNEWHKYLKRNAASYVRYLTMIADSLEEEGIKLSEIRAGYMLNDLIKKQIYGTSA